MPTSFTQLFSVPLPIIQAPMSGAAGPELAAAISNAGGLGSLAGGYLEPAAIVESIRRLRALTARPFAMNLFTFEKPAPPTDVSSVLHALEPLHRELAIAAPAAAAASPGPDIDAQLRAVLGERPPIFSFTFGMPSRAMLAAFRAAGILTIGTATNLPEARALQEAGVDAVCAQGGEAGGHRGTFIGSCHDSLLPALELVRLLAPALRIPLIAAGGIRTGADIRAALDAGAHAVQIGTAFIPCPEASAPAAYKNALLRARPGDTTLITSISGRPTRGLPNRLSRTLDALPQLPPYPYQHWLTRPLRSAAAAADNPDFLGMWSGDGPTPLRQFPAATLVKTLATEARLKWE